MGLASAERRALCDLLDELGPDRPTLCAGWQTRDLAAHLAVRDRRPDAAPGILIKALAGYTGRVQQRFAALPWPELVGLVRTGPPRWSPYALGALDEKVNTAEYFVHHEDARRGQDGWAPRPADPARDAALWRTAGLVGKLSYRRSPVGIALRRPDGAEVTVRRGPSPVTLIGEPGELLLHAFGRDAVRLDFDGPEAAVATVRGLTRSM
jgi:uncharacterized protein (TIGR03085 family)